MTVPPTSIAQSFTDGQALSDTQQCQPGGEELQDSQEASLPALHFRPDGTIFVAVTADADGPPPCEGPYGSGLAASPFAPESLLSLERKRDSFDAPGHVPLAQALWAREAVLRGSREMLREYVTGSLGLWSGWEEAVSTALMGDWTAPVANGLVLDVSNLDMLRREIRTLHAQLQPLWRRRTGGLLRRGHRTEGKRVILLESPLTESLTLRDLLAETTCPEDPLLDKIPGDPRLVAILNALEPTEREVVLALGLPGVETWPEAAEYVGAAHPSDFAEHVRRRVRRLVAEQRRRNTQRRPDQASGLWQPEHKGAQT
ncbi:hypothetical protein [Streptomyces sp. AC627_RSS907]|uniref:hypothetical protein n=1 Tax=Streptomyces sp. AC627_RSS907 TaxID=2823684 RepID=UPI001C2151A7|nr:hypothetical protein [Streptomyces sp. AC627_RSS907]